MPEEGVSLREHLESQIAELDKRLALQIDGLRAAQREGSMEAKQAVAAALAAQKEAVSAALASVQRESEKTERAAEKRFEGLNEFRGSMQDQQSRLMPRAEAEVGMGALREKIAELNSRMDRGDGRGAGLNAGWGYLAGAVGLLAGIAGLAARFMN